MVAGNAYASAEVLFAAIEKAGTLDREAIRDAIRTVNMMTAAGPVRFNEMGMLVGKPLVVAQWIGGDRKIVHANKDGKRFPRAVPVIPLKFQPKWSER